LKLLYKSPRDKGEQLEKLAELYLHNEGYEISRREIGPGGHEIDLVAERSQQAMGTTYDRPVLVECKALEQPASTRDWLKFLGKLYQEQTAHGEDYIGIFISLSGVSGTVMGEYRALQGDEIEVVSGSALERRILTDLDILNRNELKTKLPTQEENVNAKLLFRDSSFYWYFERDTKEALIIDARSFDKEVPDDILELAADNLGAETIAITDSLANAMFTKQLRKAIIGWCLSTSRVESEDWLFDRVREATKHFRQSFSREKFHECLEDLQQEGFVGWSSDELTVEESPTAEQAANILQEYIALPTFPPGLFTSNYKSLIESALPVLLQYQGDVETTPEWTETIRELLFLSPSGLREWLEPGSEIARAARSRDYLRSAKGLSDEQIDQMHRLRRSALKDGLINSFYADLQNSRLRLAYLANFDLERYEHSVTIEAMDSNGDTIGEFKKDDKEVRFKFFDTDEGPEVVQLAGFKGSENLFEEGSGAFDEDVYR
jgi:hypothetical protein